MGQYPNMNEVWLKLGRTSYQRKLTFQSEGSAQREGVSPLREDTKSLPRSCSREGGDGERAFSSKFAERKGLNCTFTF